jgi:hypothetical protein
MKWIYPVKKHDMKIYIYLILSLLLVGCSTTYTINNFPSQNKFYDSFNNSVQYKEIKVITKSDSIITTSSAFIKSDTLFTALNSFPLENVKLVKYKNNWKAATWGSVFGVIGGLLIELNIVGENIGAIPFFAVAVVVDAAIGGFLGWVVGSNICYQFNP